MTLPYRCSLVDAALAEVLGSAEKANELIEALAGRVVLLDHTTFEGHCREIRRAYGHK